MAAYIPYSRKDCWVESLANMAIAKLKPYKLVVSINSPSADLFIQQTFSNKCFKRVNSPNHSPCQTFPLYSRGIHMKASFMVLAFLVLALIIQNASFMAFAGYVIAIYM